MVQRGRRALPAVALVAAMLFAASSGVARATTPRPTPDTVPGVTTTAYGLIDVFYQRSDRRLSLRAGDERGLPGRGDLGGVLTSGPAGITIGSEFEATWVFARGADEALWYRVVGSGDGGWRPWTSVGGRSLGAPTTSCVGDITARPIVWVRGVDRALWRRSLAGGPWERLGGVLGSDPAVAPSRGGQCPVREDVFVLGTDLAVWEFAGGAFQRVGGRSPSAPAAVELRSGETDLFVRGADGALWMNSRAAIAAPWAGWHRVGGRITSPPVATVFPASPPTRTIFALGADGDLWRGRNVVGTTTWAWDEVP
jgi:hypothetical protein